MKLKRMILRGFVMISLRGLIGTASFVLILLIEILALSETRQQLGHSDWGLYWLSRFANESFIFCSAVNIH